MHQLWRKSWPVMAIAVLSCTQPPILYENPKHSITVRLPGGVGVGTESEGPARPEICEGDAFQVTWLYVQHKRSRSDSPGGFTLFTCRLRQAHTVDELVRIERTSFVDKGGVARDAGPGTIEVAAAGSVSRLTIKIAGQRLVVAMVMAEKADALGGPEAALFLESAQGHPPAQ